MKTKNLLNKKITQWLLLVAMLVGCSANAWAADCGSTSVAANTTIYVDASYVSGDFSNVYLSLVTDTNKGKADSIKNGDVSGMSGYKPSSDTWNFKTRTSKSGNVYTFKITSAQTIYGIAVWAGDLSSYGDIWQTNVSATCEFVAGGTYTIMPDKTYHNDRQSYGYTGTWESFSPCDGYTVPTEVLNGTNIMFYVEGQYDGNACITNGSTATIGTSTKIENKKAAINVATSEIPNKVYVTNNCGGWAGTGSISKSNIKAGGYYKYDESLKNEPKTLETFSPSSASITEGTASVNITVKGSSEKSAYSGQDFKLYSIIYVGNDKDGCIAVSTSDQTYTLNTSSLTQGTDTVRSVLTDGHIYYLDKSFTLTVTSDCTSPTAAQYSVSNNTYTYDGTVKTVSISPVSDAGAVTKTYYDGVEGGKTNAGTYKVTIDSEAGSTYCAASGLEVGNLVINKANQAELTLSSGALSACVAGGSITFSISGGSGDGAVTYAITSGTGGSISGNTLTATQAGTFTVQATKAASTNYNAKTSNEVTVTFNAGPTAGSITASPASPICKGTSTTLTVAGFTDGSTLQWYKGSSILTGETSASYRTENLSEAATYKVVVTNNGCTSETAPITINVQEPTLTVALTSAAGDNKVYVWEPATFTPTTNGTITAKDITRQSGSGSYFVEDGANDSKIVKAGRDGDVFRASFTTSLNGCTKTVTKDVTVEKAVEVCQ